MIFTLYATGNSYSEIITALKRAGHKSKRGRDFTQTTLNAILRNEKYSGTYVYGRTKPQSPTGARTNESRPDAEMLKIPGGMPQIIDTETWAIVQKMRGERATMAGKGAAAAKEIYLLTGLLKCGECKSDMCGDYTYDQRVDKAYVKYRCSGKKRKVDSCGVPKIDRDLIENAVLDFIEQEFFSADAIDRITKYLGDLVQKTELDRRSTSIAQEIKETEMKIDNAIQLVLQGLTSPALTKTLTDLEAHKAILDTQLSKAKIEEAASPEVTVTKIRAFVDRHRNLHAKTRQEQKNIIRTFIRTIYLYHTPDSPDGDWRIEILSIRDSAYCPLSPCNVALTFLQSEWYTIRF